MFPIGELRRLAAKAVFLGEVAWERLYVPYHGHEFSTTHPYQAQIDHRRCLWCRVDKGVVKGGGEGRRKVVERGEKDW